MRWKRSPHKRYSFALNHQNHFCRILYKLVINLYFVGEKELVEFLTEEILAERKAQKVKTIPTEISGFKASLNGAEVTLTKKTDNEK